MYVNVYMYVNNKNNENGTKETRKFLNECLKEREREMNVQKREKIILMNKIKNKQIQLRKTDQNIIK